MSPNIAPKRTRSRSAHSTADDNRENPMPIPSLAESESELPCVVRLPKSPKPFHWIARTGSAVNGRVLGPIPLVKSVVVARKGASRGIRLVHLGSLLEHLNGLMDQQEEGKGGSDE